MSDAAGNLLLALLTVLPAAVVARHAWPPTKLPHESLLWDWLFRVFIRPGSCALIFASYVLGVLGSGPFSDSPGWVPVFGAGYILFLAVATAAEQRSSGLERPT